MSTRRKFLLATAGVAAASGALVVGWSLMPVRQRLVGSLPLPANAFRTACIRPVTEACGRVGQAGRRLRRPEN